MKRGFLSQYFSKVVAKRLSAVEANPENSNQHEFNGTRELKKIFGTGAGEAQKFPAEFIWMGKENETLTSEGFLTWYDARQEHPKRTEYRLYFPATEVSEVTRQGDLLIIAQKTNGSFMVIIVASDSTIENQLMWLFDLEIGQINLFVSRDIDSESDKEVDFIVRFILDELGIDLEDPEAARLDELLKDFKGIFPRTDEFSAFARKTLKEVSPVEEPDTTLIKWMDHEEKLFRRLERHMVSKRLSEGFVDNNITDIDGFISFSLSVQNRRKSRAGYALEYHLAELFRIHEIKFSKYAVTEEKARPDFLFPGEKEYHDSKFPSTLLTMLGVKTSCKDRWRQVLSEAAKIKKKHLFTLEPGISEYQTAEMRAKNLQLIIPESLKSTYSKNNIEWLMNLDDFLGLVKEKQSKTGFV